MATEQVKLCVNCKYHTVDYYKIFHNCVRRVDPKRDANLVSGGIEVNSYNTVECKRERALSGNDYCGPSGKFFVKKPSVIGKLIALFR